MKKYQKDFVVAGVEHLSSKHILLRLTPSDGQMPPMEAGQFAELKIDGSSTTFLRRPISLHRVDNVKDELWLLVAMIGDGTRQLGRLSSGDTINLILPLGHGFSIPQSNGSKCLLVGGGVGVAPLLMLGETLRQQQHDVTFLLGARSTGDILEKELYESVGRVFITTEDGTLGERGFVTDHSLLQQEKFDIIYSCGPKPMMKSVARYARKTETPCEVSLENMMACGLGACLCCVEKTREGNKCVCKEGPVFNINELSNEWE